VTYHIGRVREKRCMVISVSAPRHGERLFDVERSPLLAVRRYARQGD
jgi:hypothetical protein